MALPLLLGSGIKDAVGSIPPVVWKTAIATGLGVGTYLVVRKVVIAARRNAALKEFGESGAVDMATLFYQAMWENDPFGMGLSEDEKLIFDTAERIEKQKLDFSKIQQAYKKIYDKDLLRDIQRSLSPEEFQKFNQIFSNILGQLPFSALVATMKHTTIFTKDMQRAIPVKEKVKLGRHFETIILANKRKLTGFMKNNKLYYVPEKDVYLISA